MRAFNKCFSIIILPVFILSACQSDALYKETRNIDNNIWQADYSPTFEIPVKQPSGPYDLFLEVRVSEKFKTQNLWMFYEIEAPDGSLQHDTAQYFLFDARGRPYGEQFGDEIRYELLYKGMVSFPEKGTYIVRATQGMRTGQEPRISEVTLFVKASQFTPKPQERENTSQKDE